jgi:hypothetical protein
MGNRLQEWGRSLHHPTQPRWHNSRFRRLRFKFDRGGPWVRLHSIFLYAFYMHSI